MTKKKQRRIEVERILTDVLQRNGYCNHPVLAVSVDDDYYVYVLMKYETKNEPAEYMRYIAGDKIRRILDGDEPLEENAKGWELHSHAYGAGNAPSTESVQ